MYNNVFYQKHIGIIGGVETFLYELARMSSANNRDLTIVYRTGDNEQIQRLKKYCRVVQFDNIKKPIQCNKAFFNYNVDTINCFEANEYIQVIHADFKIDPNTKGLPLIQTDKITQYYAVSDVVAKSFRELTGYDVKTLYNPINIDDEPKVMTLISAQRMVEAKGSKRIEKFIKMLDDSKITYVWHIFSDIKLSVCSENVIYHAPTLDIRKWIKYADYMVLLSDSEGFAYGLYESLCLGTPVITTPISTLKELGINKNNGIVVDFDLSNLDVQDVYKKSGTFKFSYKQKENRWIDLLTGESTYVAPKFVKIRALNKYIDNELNRVIEAGEVYEVTEYRADTIVSKGFASYVET